MVLLAALIGPFSAVLMIPRSQNFPAGGTQYFLGASADELWPGAVSSDDEIEACFWSNVTQYAVCPSGGYASLRNHGTFHTLYDAWYFRPGVTADWGVGPSDLALEPTNIMPPMFTHWTQPLCATQPQAYSVILQEVLVRYWYSAIFGNDAGAGVLSSSAEFHYSFAVHASASSTHPLTHVKCSLPQNLSQHAETAEFPYFQSKPSSDPG